MWKSWISRGVHASIRHTELDNQAGERVAELIFLFSLRSPRDRGKAARAVEKIFAFV